MTRRQHIDGWRKGQAPAGWYTRAGMRLYRAQERLIRERYGKKAADNANYGWGVESGSDVVSIATKVYRLNDPMVLTSTARYKQGKDRHDWTLYDRAGLQAYLAGAEQRFEEPAR